MPTTRLVFLTVFSIGLMNLPAAAQNEPANATPPAASNVGPNLPANEPNPRSTRRSRLSRLPKMYGDSLSTTTIEVSGDENSGSSSFTFPDCSTTRIGDNNSPIPTNRVYFLYQHFHNATESVDNSFYSSPNVQSNDVNIYTIGVEKTFFEDLVSLELRLPLVSTNLPGSDASGSSDASLKSITSVLKASLWQTDASILSAGLAIAFPLDGCTVGSESVVYNQNANYFVPFLGFAHAFNDFAFLNSFAQVNLPSASNSLSGSSGDVSLIREQETLGLHLSGGVWLYRNPQPTLISGVAGLLELHYTTVLGGDREVEADGPFGGGATLRYDRYDSLSLTSGLHFEVGQTNFRVGAVCPLRQGEDKFFDTEIHVSVNRYF